MSESLSLFLTHSLSPSLFHFVPLNIGNTFLSFLFLFFFHATSFLLLLLFAHFSSPPCPLLSLLLRHLIFLFRVSFSLSKFRYLSLAPFFYLLLPLPHVSLISFYTLLHSPTFSTSSFFSSSCSSSFVTMLTSLYSPFFYLPPPQSSLLLLFCLCLFHIVFFSFFFHFLSFLIPSSAISSTSFSFFPPSCL